MTVRVPDAELVVTAPHRHSLKQAHRPWATYHLKRLGNGTTACGLAAPHWPLFWNVVFDADDELACPLCVEVLRLSAQFSGCGA